MDDVTELWNAQHLNDKVVPEPSPIQDIEWITVLCRSSSEDNLLPRLGRNVVIRDKPKWERNLSQRDLGSLRREWPPTPREAGKVFAGQRLSAGTDPGEWF